MRRLTTVRNDRKQPNSTDLTLLNVTRHVCTSRWALREHAGAQCWPTILNAMLRPIKSSVEACRDTPEGIMIYNLSPHYDCRAAVCSCTPCMMPWQATVNVQLMCACTEQGIATFTKLSSRALQCHGPSLVTSRVPYTHGCRAIQDGQKHIA